MSLRRQPLFYPRARFIKQRGLVAIFVTVAFLFLMGIAALSIDINHAFMNKSKLQNAVDAAALAGATMADDGAEQADIEHAIKETLTKTVQFAGNSGFSDMLSVTEDENGNVSNAYLSISYSNDPRDSDAVNWTSTLPVGDVYIRVALDDYPIHNFIVQLFGLEKNISASAVAGRSTSANPCNIVPLAVCSAGETVQDDDGNIETFFGYEIGRVYALKTSSTDLSSGNFQLLALGGAGANILRNNLAGEYDQCVGSNVSVTTQPGGASGPVQEGLNTRFGLSKNMDTKRYPPDVYVREPAQNKRARLDKNGDVIYNDSWSYAMYEANVSQCLKANASSYSDCRPHDAQPPAVAGTTGRRILAIPMTNCTGMKGGKANDLPVDGIGCFFLLQSVDVVGVKQVIFGEFIGQCSLANGTLNDESNNEGPYKIVLYKDPFSQES